MPITPPITPPTAPSTVFLGLTRGASLCLPKSIPANRAQVSEPKEMQSGKNTSSIPMEDTIRSRSRQESISGNTGALKIAAVTAAKGCPDPRHSGGWPAGRPRTRTLLPDAHQGQLRQCGELRRLHRHLRVHAHRHQRRRQHRQGIRGFPPPRPRRASAPRRRWRTCRPAAPWWPTQGPAQYQNQNGTPTTATITRLNIKKSVLISVKDYFFTPPKRRSLVRYAAMARSSSASSKSGQSTSVK